MNITAAVLDITKIEGVDAIVNSANVHLTDSSPYSVNHAVYKAAGPDLDTALRKIGYCSIGKAVLTESFNIPCRFIIHTVAPVWMGHEKEMTKELENCYASCLNLARKNGIRSIAFPSLASGNKHFPIALAAEAAVLALVSFLEQYPDAFDTVVWCLKNEKTADYYKAAIRSLVPDRFKSLSEDSLTSYISRSSGENLDENPKNYSVVKHRKEAAQSNRKLFDFCCSYRLILALAKNDPDLYTWCRQFQPGKAHTGHDMLRDILLYRMTSDAHHAGFMSGKPDTILKKNGQSIEKLKALSNTELCHLNCEILKAALELEFLKDEKMEGILISESVAEGWLQRLVDSLYTILYPKVTAD